MKRMLLFPLVILLSACAHSEEWPPKPAAVHLGEDVCATCRMIISEEHFGAQLHQKGRPVEFFDDYGCLLIRKRPDETRARIVYVRSMKDASWLREDQSFYVVSKEIRSPMGYGIAAFADKESAANFAGGFSDSKTYTSSEFIAGAEKILRGRPFHKE